MAHLGWLFEAFLAPSPHEYCAIRYQKYSDYSPVAVELDGLPEGSAPRVDTVWHFQRLSHNDR